MKKALVSFFVCILLLCPVLTTAQEVEIMPVPGPDNSVGGIVFGQNHNYSVTMRGNGEAVITARIAFTNFSDNDLSELKFSSDDQLYELMAYQQVLPQVCDESVYNQETKSSDCKKYSDPNYYQNNRYYYGNSKGSAKYFKLKSQTIGDLLSINLEQSVKPDKQGAIILSYYSKSYVEKKWGGLFKFNFNNLKAPVRIKEINVAISTDADLVMRGQKTTVNYDTALSAVGESAGLGATSFQNKSLDEASRKIGYSGTINKKGTDLAPEETLNVPGTYATSKLRLNLCRIVTTIIVLILLITGIYFLNRHFGNRKPKQPKPEPEAIPKQKSHDSQINLFNGHYLTWAFVSSLCLFGLTYALNWLDDIRWYKVLPDGFESMILIGIIVLILVYLFLVFGVPAIFASKRGWQAFVSVLLDIVIISAILFVLLIAILAVT